MSASNTHNGNNDKNAGIPPAPSTAHGKAGVKGEKYSVVLNGVRLDHEHDGTQWWIVKVTPQSTK